VGFSIGIDGTGTFLNGKAAGVLLV